MKKGSEHGRTSEARVLQQLTTRPQVIVGRRRVSRGRCVRVFWVWELGISSWGGGGDDLSGFGFSGGFLMHASIYFGGEFELGGGNAKF